MFFREESEIDDWCKANQQVQGAVLELETVWQLAQLWYRDRMAKDFRGRTLDSVQMIFKNLGLVDQFWKAE